MLRTREDPLQYCPLYSWVTDAWARPHTSVRGQYCRRVASASHTWSPRHQPRLRSSTFGSSNFVPLPCGPKAAPPYLLRGKTLSAGAGACNWSRIFFSCWTPRFMVSWIYSRTTYYSYSLRKKWPIVTRTRWLAAVGRHPSSKGDELYLHASPWTSLGLR